MTETYLSKQHFLLNLKRQVTNLRAVGQHLLIGFSGGADSTALLYALRQIRHDLDITITAAHFNHRLREADSATDAEWVTTFAKQLDLPLVIENWQHNREPTASGLEETARAARYEFLQQTAARLKCNHVAVAHTADDQVETILHHVLRGTGIAGLRGIPESRELCHDVKLIRPLLNTTRAEIELYLQTEDIGYRQDATNANTDWTRNRIRNVLVPMLEEQYNPNLKQVLLQLGRQADDVEQALQFWSRQILQEVLLDRQPNVVRLQVETLKSYPAHIIRECLKQIWIEQHWPRQRMGFEHWSRLAKMVTEPTAPIELHLPAGLRANRRGSILVLSRQS